MAAAHPLPPRCRAPRPVHIPPPTLLARLEAADWSPRAVEAALPEVAALAATLDPADRVRWLVGLRSLHQRHGWALPAAAGAGGGVGRLAAGAALGGGAGGGGGLAIGSRRLLAEGLLRLGAPEEAADLLRGVLLRCPGDPAATAVYAAALEWAAFRARVACAPPPQAEPAEPELWLEPLGHHHLADFARQYYDPAIARLCRLPAFASEAEWHRWLTECWGYGDQRLHAVVQREWGFVGGVSLTLHDGVGYFYYWLGRDFQGHGLGPAAVRLLLEDAARHHGLHTCYAKVFAHNAPSRRALEKLGFEATGFGAIPPDDDELFYRLGAPRPRAEVAREVHRLLERMESETVAAVPWS